MFEGKKVIALGERDGVPGPAIAECVEAAGGEVIPPGVRRRGIFRVVAVRTVSNCYSITNIT